MRCAEEGGWVKVTAAMPSIRSNTSRPAHQSVPAVLPIRCQDEVRLVPICDIWYCTCMRNTTFVVANAGEIRVSMTLDGLEDRLAPHGFFRAHRGYLVNLQQVRSIMVWSRNAYTLVLQAAERFRSASTALGRSGGSWAGER